MGKCGTLLTELNNHDKELRMNAMGDVLSYLHYFQIYKLGNVSQRGMKVSLATLPQASLLLLLDHQKANIHCAANLQ